MRKVVQEITALRGNQPRREQQLELQESKPMITKSITKSEFAKHCENLLLLNSETNTTELTDQFKQLALFSPPPPSTHPDNYSEAVKQYNRRKNRYINILPCE